MFNMITGINELKTLKHISCKCKCKLDGTKLIQINGRITIEVDVSVKNIYVKKKNVWNPATLIYILMTTANNFTNIHSQ